MAHINTEAMPAASRRLNISDALDYLEYVKTQFTSTPRVYNSFLDIMKDFNTKQIDTEIVIQRVIDLFKEYPDLVEGFNTFLPEGYSIIYSKDPRDPNPIKVYTPLDQDKATEPIKGVEMQDAVQFVTKVQHRFIQAPEIAEKFCVLLRTYRSELVPNKEVFAQVSELFQNTAPDLLQEFAMFLGDLNSKSWLLSGSNPVKKEKLDVSVPVVDSSIRTTLKTPQTLKTPVTVYKIEHDPHAVLTSPDYDEEVKFFKKAKYLLGPYRYPTFLKLVDLYTKGIMNKATLVERSELFFIRDPQLFAQFKKFLKYESKPLHIEEIEFKKHRLELGLCKRQGPSYRQLPKQETLMPCSGRDEMCYEVLNDEWVGHPTWDSEDSGYIAHRKNQYEDALFRIEEERHEYDHVMENNMRTIETLETIAKKLATMGEKERKEFKLSDGLGHTSKTIYKKVIRKVYGSEQGFKVLDALHESPSVAVPVVLSRLKQKDLEWRKMHNMWCKVWRDQEMKLFYKSLDHLGLTFKQTDKKLLTTKQLVAELNTIKMDLPSKRMIPMVPKAREILKYNFGDAQVFSDILVLVNTWIEASTYSAGDKSKLKDFFVAILELLFNIDTNATAPADAHSRRGIDLSELLKRNKKTRTDSDNEEDFEKAEENWIETTHENSAGTPTNERNSYNFYCNTTIYVFFRYLQVLYYRLVELKQMEAEVSQEIRARTEVRFAKDLDLTSCQLDEMDVYIDGNQNCYTQVLQIAQRLIRGELDHQWYEESLRHAYRNRAFKLFTVDKVVQGLVKHMHSVTSDTNMCEMVLLFDENRHANSIKQLIVYRMRVRSLLQPEENMFRIEFYNKTSRAEIQFVALDDLTLKDVRSPEQQYNYYLTSYLMSHPTEGVPIEMVNYPFLKSLIVHSTSENIESFSESNLRVSIDKESYKLKFMEGATAEYVRKSGPKSRGTSKDLAAILDGEFGWKNGLGSPEVESGLEKFNKLFGEKAQNVPSGDVQTHDVK